MFRNLLMTGTFCVGLAIAGRASAGCAAPIVWDAPHPAIFKLFADPAHTKGKLWTPWIGVYGPTDTQFSTSNFGFPGDTSAFLERVATGGFQLPTPSRGAWAEQLEIAKGGEFDSGRLVVFLTAQSNECPPCARIERELQPSLDRLCSEPDTRLVIVRMYVVRE